VRTIALLIASFVLAVFAAACSSSPMTTPNAATGGPLGSVLHQSRGAIRGWMSRNAKKQLLYVSLTEQNIVDLYSIPSYSLVGQITDGIDFPQGMTTDKLGNLYVANLGGNSVTVYAKGATSPSRTLTDPYGPTDVALTNKGDLLVGDNGGGVTVFAPNASSPSTRLTNPDLYSVGGVGADAHGNAYAAGNNVSYAPVVVKFAHLSGSGANLNLTDLNVPSGVLVDASGNIVVSDYSLPGVNIYPPHSTNPSATIAAGESPSRSALNKPQSLIYVPEGTTYAVNLYDYPSGSSVASITTTGFTRAVALSPPARP
jgi:hypothetical protein